jgi:hypothetical protein
VLPGSPGDARDAVGERDGCDVVAALTFARQGPWLQMAEGPLRRLSVRGVPSERREPAVCADETSPRLEMPAQPTVSGANVYVFGDPAPGWFIVEPVQSWFSIDCLGWM